MNVREAAKILVVESARARRREIRSMAARCRAAYPSGGVMRDACQRLAAAHEAAAAVYDSLLAAEAPEGRYRLNAFVDEMAACWLYQEYERQLKINPISMDAMLAALRKMESLEDDVREERDQLRADVSGMRMEMERWKKEAGDAEEARAALGKQ